MRRLFLVGLFAAVCAADGRFSHEAKDETLTSVVAKLNKHFGFKLTLGDGLASKRVTLTFREATAPQALRALADAAEQKLFRIEPGVYRIGINERERIFALLGEKMVQVTNFNAPIKTTCQWLRSVTGTNIFVDPSVAGNPAVRMKAAMTASQALDTITQQAKLAWDVRFGVVFIATAARLKTLPQESPFRALGLPAEKRVSLPLNNSNLKSAASYLTAATGVKITIDPELRSKRVTINATNVLLVDALALLLVPHGYTLEKKGDGFVIKTKK